MAQGKRVSLAVIHKTRCLVFFGVFLISPCLDMHGSGDSLVWRWILRCMNLWLVLWTRQDTEYQIWTQISRVHSPVVKAADCRSAGPWFNSGWRTLFTFVTWYDKLTNDDFLMINIMSPITTSTGRLQESQLTFWTWLTELNFLLYMTQRLEPSSLQYNLQKLNPFKKWLKELNLYFLNLTNWIFFTWLNELNLLFKMTQRIELFFEHDSKNWTFFSWKKIEPSLLQMRERERHYQSHQQRGV